MQMRKKWGQTLRNTRHNPERHHLPQHIANCEVGCRWGKDVDEVNMEDGGSTVDVNAN